MAHLTCGDNATAPKFLTDASSAREAALEALDEDVGHTETDNDSEEDSEHPVLDIFYKEGVTAALLNVEDTLQTLWNDGRGKQASFSAQDILFMSLITLKHADHWEFRGPIFNVNVKWPIFERMDLQFFRLISPCLYERVVHQCETRFNISKLVQDWTTFTHNRCALYANIVIFQQSNRPCGNHAGDPKFTLARITDYTDTRKSYSYSRTD